MKPTTLSGRSADRSLGAIGQVLLVTDRTKNFRERPLAVQSRTAAPPWPHRAHLPKQICPLIHQVAYVENLNPFRQSNFSTVCMRPTDELDGSFGGLGQRSSTLLAFSEVCWRQQHLPGDGQCDCPLTASSPPRVLGGAWSDEREHRRYV
jgi:hypothetical protein